MNRYRRSHSHTLILFVCVLFIQIAAQDPVQSPLPKPASQPNNDQQEKPGRSPESRTAEQRQDSPNERIKIDTQLVQLDVSVIDRNNLPVYNLNKENFTVYEDKVKQMIESVGREEVPISFGLIIDTSGSMRSKLLTVKNAALDLLKQMRSDDEGFIVQFKLETEFVQALTRDRLKLETSLGELYTSGGTALLDAIMVNSAYLTREGKQRRKALVVISDGLEKNSSAKEKEVKQAIKESEVQLYLVGFTDEEKSFNFFGKSEGKKAKELLVRLADDSGGRAFFPKDLGEIPGIAAQISKELRTQYVVNYYPSNEKKDGAFRVVRVVVNDKDNHKLIARTRQGYYARSDK